MKNLKELNLMWVVYERFDKSCFDNPWFCPQTRPVAAFRDEDTAEEFAAKTPVGGKSTYFVKNADPWEGGGLMQQRTIKIPYELFRKIVAFCVFGYNDGKIETELHDELDAFIQDIKPQDYQ